MSPCKETGLDAVVLKHHSAFCNRQLHQRLDFTRAKKKKKAFGEKILWQNCRIKLRNKFNFWTGRLHAMYVLRCTKVLPNLFELQGVCRNRQSRPAACRVGRANLTLLMHASQKHISFADLYWTFCRYHPCQWPKSATA